MVLSFDEQSLCCVYCDGEWTLEGESCLNKNGNLSYEIAPVLDKRIADSIDAKRHDKIKAYRETIKLAAKMIGDIHETAKNENTAKHVPDMLAYASKLLQVGINNIVEDIPVSSRRGLSKKECASFLMPESQR
jgi:hypothetical protein